MSDFSSSPVGRIGPSRPFQLSKLIELRVALHHGVLRRKSVEVNVVADDHSEVGLITQLVTPIKGLDFSPVNTLRWMASRDTPLDRP